MADGRAYNGARHLGPPASDVRRADPPIRTDGLVPAAGHRPHDSYTGSLADLVARVAGARPTVVQHDRVDVEEVLDGGYTHRDVSATRAIAGLFPPASMTGAPKRRTMELIEQVETSARGAYSGALGWIGFDGRADLGVVIRTITMVGDRLVLGTGGAITVHSELRAEYDETRWKIAHLTRALLGAPPTASSPRPCSETTDRTSSAVAG